MWDFIADLLSVFGSFPGSRVTVEDRYEMKRKVRELKNREREDAARETPAVPQDGKRR
jgi:hypothetical protein